MIIILSMISDSMVTYQISKDGKFGRSYKVAPMTTENITNQQTCFQVNGTANSTVGAQAVLPDLKFFKV